MKQYLLDEIRRADLEPIRAYLNDHATPSSLEGIWWVDLSEDLLDPRQSAHPEHRPFRFAVELGDDFVRFEFLIRSRETMRCACIAYASPAQRDFILAFADQMVEDLALRT